MKRDAEKKFEIRMRRPRVKELREQFGLKEKACKSLFPDPPDENEPELLPHKCEERYIEAKRIIAEAKKAPRR